MFFFKQKTAYEMRIIDWSSDVCSSDLLLLELGAHDGVDRSERLVHQQDVRIGRETAGDADALLLAAGQLARIAVGHRRVEERRVGIECVRTCKSRWARDP